jgi:PilZ domain-containing protein/sporulation related protein
MTGPERRQYPRTTLQTFAYINLGANNYGSVLNISETGLSFRSVMPVARNRTIRFWFSEHSHRIEAIGEVTWTDETQKTGGLRFTTLSAEAREQIHFWISNPSVLHDFGPVTGADPASIGTFQPPAGPADWAVPRKLRVKVQTTGFTGGLAIGLAVAALVAGGFVFQNYRRQFGESLIRMGERFAAKPTAQTPPAEPVPTQAMQPAQALSPSPRPVAPAPASVQAPAIERAEASQPKPLAIPPSPQPAKLESAALTTTAPTTIVPAQQSPAAIVPGASDTAAKKANSTPVISSPPPAISLPSATRIAASNLVPGKLELAPPVQPTTTSPVPSNSGSEVTEVSTGSAKAGPPPEMFLEVGKFKDQRGARKATEQLSELGFPTTVHQKSRLWSNSYLVLVGPFGDEQKAAAASHDLVVRDFRPRPFERGSHDITFRNGLILNGTHVPEGDCTVRWESYITDTVVKILQDNLLVTTASGQWVKTDTKYRRDAFVVRRNPDGSRTLLEIQFGGFAKTLVFNKPS